MKVVFVSNFLNHHQIPLCEELKARCEEFYFIATENSTNVGYQKATEKEYVVHFYNAQEKEQAKSLIISADLVLFGACSNELVKLRMQYKKLSFIYSERVLKKGAWRRFIPSTRKTINERFIQYKDKNLHVLCASAYLPYDLSLLGFPLDKCYKWGYFPYVKKHEDIEKILELKHPVSILWAGRLIELKHPEHVIKLAKSLRDKGYNFQLNIIGDGPLKNKLKTMIKANRLEERVSLLGGMSTEQVREYMEQSQIFLFTSNRKEGWGAVLNEAMNSGCAVVASNAIGSVPFLIKEVETGLTYKSGNVKDLEKKVQRLLDNPLEQKKLGLNAYQSMINYWNAKVATKKLLDLASALQNGSEARDCLEGPCSSCKIIKG